jgi:hypothetical protein
MFWRYLAVISESFKGSIMIELTKIKNVASLVASYQMQEELQFNGQPITPHQNAVVRYLVSESLNESDQSAWLLRQTLENPKLLSLGWQNGYLLVGDPDEFTNCSFFDALTPEKVVSANAP